MYQAAHLPQRGPLRSVNEALYAFRDYLTSSVSTGNALSFPIPGAPAQVKALVARQPTEPLSDKRHIAYEHAEMPFCARKHFYATLEALGSKKPQTHATIRLADSEVAL